MYYYEHLNGSIIEKIEYIVDGAGGPKEYFGTSPFCVRWWQTNVYGQKIRSSDSAQHQHVCLVEK